MLVMSSIPGVTWALPVQFTTEGHSSMMKRMIEMSCGARSQATLMSFWNSPRLSRRELMYRSSPMSPFLMISFTFRTGEE